MLLEFKHIITMISKILCDTEDAGSRQFGFAITGINYILKYIKIEKLF